MLEDIRHQANGIDNDNAQDDKNDPTPGVISFV